MLFRLAHVSQKCYSHQIVKQSTTSLLYKSLQQQANHSFASEQFYNFNDGSTYTVMESQNTDWSILLTNSTYLPETINSPSPFPVPLQNQRMLKELFAQLLLCPPSQDSLFSNRTGSLTSICKKTKNIEGTDSIVRETSFEKQLAYYSRKNKTKLVLALDYSPALRDDIRISYSGSKVLADGFSSLLEKAGYSTLVDRNCELGHLENLLEKDMHQTNVLDIQLATPLVVCNETRKELCSALVACLESSNIKEFAARKAETLVTIPSDLDFFAGNMLKRIPSAPEVQVLHL